MLLNLLRKTLFDINDKFFVNSVKILQHNKRALFSCILAHFDENITGIWLNLLRKRLF